MNRYVARTVLAVIIAAHLVLAVFYCLNQNLDPGSEGYAMLSEGAFNHYSKQTLDLTNDSLKSIMISAPMNLWENTLAPVILLIFLRLLAFFLVYRELSGIFSRETMLWFAGVFLLSPWILYSTTLGADAYLQLGAAAYLISSLKLTRSGLPRSSTFLWTAVHLFSIAWCLALSPSWGVLLIASVILWIKGTIHPNIGGIIASLAVFAVIFIPYVNQLSSDENATVYLSHSYVYPGHGVVYMYPLVKGLMYWVRYTSTLFQNEILFQTGFEWTGAGEGAQYAMRCVWIGTMFVTGVLTALISTMATYVMIREIRPVMSRDTFEKSWLERLETVSAAMLPAIVIYVAVTPYALGSGTLSVCYIFAMVPLLVVIEKFSGVSAGRHLAWLGAVLIFLTAVNAFSVTESKDYDAGNNYRELSGDIVRESFN